MWRVLGGSATGTSHAAAGIPCQDSYGWYISPNGIVCLTVADGAGSRPRSGEGSAAAIRAVLDWATAAALTPDSDPQIRDAFLAALNAVGELAATENIAATDLATTLAVVLIGSRSLLVGQIGDSIVVLRRKSGEFVRITPEPRSEYINETVFLTTEGAVENIRLDTFVTAEEFDGVALSTDGLRYKIIEDFVSGEAFSPFFEDVFAWPGQPQSTSEGVARFLGRIDDQTGDDKTLVVTGRITSATGINVKSERVVNQNVEGGTNWQTQSTHLVNADGISDTGPADMRSMVIIDDRISSDNRNPAMPARLGMVFTWIIARRFPQIMHRKKDNIKTRGRQV